jgi:hypothetical protein
MKKGLWRCKLRIKRLIITTTTLKALLILPVSSTVYISAKFNGTIWICNV